MRVQLLIRDKDYRDALTEMIAGTDMDIYLEVESDSSKDGSSVILTDIRPDEIDMEILKKISKRTLFLASVRPGTDTSDDDVHLHRIFKYSCLSSILSELVMVHHEWTGDTGGIRTVSRTLAVISETDYRSSDRCIILARQIIYRVGGSVLILPLGPINDYSYDTGEAHGWFTRLMYLIDEGRDFPIDSFAVKDSYGVSYLMLPKGLNPVAGLSAEYLSKLIMSVGCRFDTLILDIGSSLRHENTDIASRSDGILFFGSGRRIPDIGKILGRDAEGKITQISTDTGADESISIDEFVISSLRK